MFNSSANSELAMKPLYLEAMLIAYKKLDLKGFVQNLKTFFEIRNFRFNDYKEKDEIKTTYFDVNRYKKERNFCAVTEINNKTMELITNIGRIGNFITINGIYRPIESLTYYTEARLRNEPIGGGWFTSKEILKPSLESKAKYQLFTYIKDNKKILVRAGKIHYKKDLAEREENIILIRTKRPEEDFLDFFLKQRSFSIYNYGEYSRGMSLFKY